MSEFKSGDVVLHPKYGRGIVQTREWVEFADVDDYAKLPDIAADLRRLVVIDPEDREQVERLLNGYYSEPFEDVWPRSIDKMQAAFREFANPKPPKPEEPTGLGAVVEDADGMTLVRCHQGTRPWQVLNGTSVWHWDAIDAVRVLSEGVQP